MEFCFGISKDEEVVKLSEASNVPWELNEVIGKEVFLSTAKLTLTLQVVSSYALEVWKLLRTCEVNLSSVSLNLDGVFWNLRFGVGFRTESFAHRLLLRKDCALAIERLIRYHECGDQVHKIYEKSVTMRTVYLCSQKLRVHREDRAILSSCPPNGMNLERKEGEKVSMHHKGDLLTGLVDLAFANMVGFLNTSDYAGLRYCSKSIAQVLRDWVPGLKLSLFGHQVNALQWMERREQQVLHRSKPDYPGAIKHPCWLKVPSNSHSSIEWWLNKSTGRLYRVDLRKGKPLLHSSSNEKDFSSPRDNVAVRGGLLCDEPGLGKTITVISLVLRSCGRKNKRKSNSPSQNVEEFQMKIAQAWFNMASFAQRSEVSSLRQSLRNATGSVRDQLMTHASTFPDRTVRDVTWALSQFDSFVFDLEKRSVNASSGEVNVSILEYIRRIATHITGDFEHKRYFHENDLAEMSADERTALVTLLNTSSEKLSTCLNSYMSRLEQKLRLTRRSCESRLLQDIREAERNRNQLESGATLVVVPKALLGHWHTQLSLHLNESFVDWPPTSSIYYVEDHDKAFPASEQECGIPPAEYLSKCLLVVISINTVSRLASLESTTQDNSPLSRIRWLRLVVDEGHALGSSTLTGYGELLKRVESQRRWVMTGTPAKEMSTRAGAKSLMGLFRFLKLAPFGLVEHNGTKLWGKLILSDLGQESGVGYERLTELLSVIMIRHTKDDVAELPDLQWVEPMVLGMSEQERKSYNAIVSSARANIVLTGIGRKGRDQSLLHARQSKFARELMNNIRLACSGWGELRAQISEKNRMELQELLQSKFNASHDEIREVNEFVARATQGETTACKRCEQDLLLVLVFPCGHCYCSECVREKAVVGERVHCLSCSFECSGDAFANFQPGLELKWVEKNNTASRLALGGLELHTGNRAVDRYTKGEVLVQLVEKLLLKYRRDNLQIVERKRKEWVRWGSHKTGVFEASTGKDSSKALWGPSLRSPLQDALDRQRDQLKALEDSSEGREGASLTHLRSREIWRRKVLNKPRPLKCIVYSQFRQVLNRLASELLNRFGQDSIAEFWGKYRNAELTKFTKGLVEYWPCPVCGYSNDAVHRSCQRMRIQARYLPGTGTGSWLSAETVGQVLLRTFFVDQLAGYQFGDSEYIQTGNIVVPDISALYSSGQSINGTSGRWVVTSRLRCRGSVKQVPALKQRKVDCFVILLSRDGSHGLDLSMANHIFVLDKIWDPAVEDQVVSRAWRLGATNPTVEVMQLLMKGTVEQLLHDVSVNKHRDLEKLHYLLKNMRIVPSPTVQSRALVDAGVDSENSTSKQQQVRKRKRKVMWSDQLE